LRYWAATSFSPTGTSSIASSITIPSVTYHQAVGHEYSHWNLEVAQKAVDDMSNAERWAVFIEYLTDPIMRATINEITGREEGIAMTGRMLLNISRSEVERAQLESEFKGQMDRQIMEGKLGKAKREGEQIGERKGVEQTARNALAESA